MKRNISNWLIAITSALLLGLLVNQVFYVFQAAKNQEHALNEKVEIALDIIVEKVSKNQDVYNSVNYCLNTEKKRRCCKYLNNEEEWETVNTIIKDELDRFNIDLNYNFDFTKDQPKGNNTYAMNMDKVFQKSGVVMYLEFPDRSKYLLRQMGPVFISSILLIIFITIAYIVTYRYYKREKKLVSRTRDFINNMTHEFKTPLANISFASNMIKRENDAIQSKKIQRYTNIIKEENQRLMDNCEDLLVTGSMENNPEPILNEQIDVHEILNRVFNRLKSVNEIPSMELKLEADKTKVLGKASVLENAFSNIIDNAIKYSKGQPEIKVKTYIQKEFIWIEINDKGIGISSEDTKVIFDKFHRVANHDQHDIKGFGLGLSYVKMAVKQMGGSIDVHSTLGEGSTFIIKLPLYNG